MGFAGAHPVGSRYNRRGGYLLLETGLGPLDDDGEPLLFARSRIYHSTHIYAAFLKPVESDDDDERRRRTPTFYTPGDDDDLYERIYFVDVYGTVVAHNELYRFYPQSDARGSKPSEMLEASAYADYHRARNYLKQISPPVLTHEMGWACGCSHCSKEWFATGWVCPGTQKWRASEADYKAAAWYIEQVMRTVTFWTSELDTGIEFDSRTHEFDPPKRIRLNADNGIRTRRGFAVRTLDAGSRAFLYPLEQAFIEVLPQFLPGGKDGKNDKGGKGADTKDGKEKGGKGKTADRSNRTRPGIPNKAWAKLEQSLRRLGIIVDLPQAKRPGDPWDGRGERPQAERSC